MDIAERISNIMAEELAVSIETITPELCFNAIPEWDSVAHMHLAMALEASFEIEFGEREIAELITVSKIIAAVTARLGETA